MIFEIVDMLQNNSVTNKLPILQHSQVIRNTAGGKLKAKVNPNLVGYNLYNLCWL